MSAGRTAASVRKPASGSQRQEVTGMRLQFDHPAGGAEGDPGRLPAVVGHRGAPHRARENTVASFLAAASEGATWVELDARRSGDGVVVVHHDPVTADGRPVVEQAASELAAKGVADLAGVLAQLPPWLGVDVECKNLPGEPDYDEQQHRVERADQQTSPGRPGCCTATRSRSPPGSILPGSSGLPRCARTSTAPTWGR